MIKSDDMLETDPTKVSNKMNNFYVNIATKIGGDLHLPQDNQSNTEYVSCCEDYFSDHSSIQNIKDKMTTKEFTFTHTTPEAVESILKDLNSKKATGYDNIPPKLLKPVAENLSHHLASVFNQCIDTCSFPAGAKNAEVTPVFKKDDNLVMKNYRPVSILPSLSKVLEKLLHKQMLPFLDQILDPRMAAYRQGYSCQYVLLRLIEDWKKALEENKHVGAILMDLSKAFDCLPHQLIIAKLKAYGMSADGCGLIWSYLSDRRQRVKIAGGTSEWLNLTKGVPQGSILGPILFNIFVNDLFAVIKTSLYNYADDNTISSISNNRAELIRNLSAKSEQAVQWFNQNMMEANPGKFQAIMLKEKTKTCFNINNTHITSEEHVKLLGVNIDNKLNFNYHVQTLCKKAGAQLSVLQRLSSSLGQNARMAIFRCFVLSHFHYCALVWNFCGKTNAKKLERIQYRALKFVYQDFDSTYPELLGRADLPTLELSRNRSIVIEVFKSLNQLSPSFMWDVFTFRNIQHNLRNKKQLVINHSRTKKYGIETFTVHGAKLWNTLPDVIKNCDTLKNFKKLVMNWKPNLYEETF